MANMSYCRFQNTVGDLRDCAEHIHDDDLSEDEQRARKRLIAILPGHRRGDRGAVG